MSKTKITSPVEGLNNSTAIGPVVLNFKDSVAEIEDEQLTPGLRSFLERNGYGIGDGEAKGRERTQVQPPDPRKVSAQRVGTPIRDGAVDPRDKDFLGPTNAGDANPHGTDVVNPEIHASQGVRPVKAGPVHVDDPSEQDRAEKAHAAAATDGTPVVLTAEERELLGLDEDEESAGDDVPDAEGEGDPNPDSESDGDAQESPADEGDPNPDSESDGDAQESPADAETPVEDLKGEALTNALKEAGLPATGSADEKRQRLQAHRDGAGA